MKRESGSCVLFSIPFTGRGNFPFCRNLNEACGRTCGSARQQNYQAELPVYVGGGCGRQPQLLRLSISCRRADQPAAASHLNQD